jgi:glycerate kinase
MKIVIAPDSFKESLTAQQVAEAISRGIKKALPQSDTLLVPMADGGEGTLQCLLDATGGQKVTVQAMNPIGERISSSYGILGDQATAVIEMAKISGLELISATQRNPLRTTTYGLGQMIRSALDNGCRKFIVGLGGSATNDAGAGMLQALGVDLLDERNQPISYGGGELQNVRYIGTERLDPRLEECTFLVACDVDNPLVGANGASCIFGPQKGATPEMIRHLDESLSHFADQIQGFNGVSLHGVPGAGAAGGLAAAFIGFLPSTLKPGVDIVIEMTELEQKLAGAELVITGEGKIDSQTAHGKTPVGVSRLAQKLGIPTIALTGTVGEGIEALKEHGILAMLSIINRPMDLESALREAPELLEQTAEQVMKIYYLGKLK